MQTTLPDKPRQMPLIALCLGFFMVIIDVTIVNVAMPSIARDLHTGISGLQWVIAGYALTFACLLLSAGDFGDRLGAKTIFLWGLTLFALTSLGCGLSSQLGVLTTFRLLQGAAAALIVPTSLALINASYANKAERAKAIGVWASIGGVAAIAGPLLGAILTSWFGWQSVFLVNVPIGAIAILLTLRYVPSPPSQTGSIARRFDFPGQILGITSIAALAFSLIEAGKQGWLSAMVIGTFIIFLLIFTLFLIVEHRSEAPMFPLSFFQSKTFSTAISIGTIINTGVYGVMFTLPLYFQEIRGYSVLMTGLAILPLFGLAAFGSFFGGRLASTFGPKIPMIAGLLLSVLGFALMLISQEHTPAYWILILPLAMIGLGTSITMPCATIAAMHAVPENRVGMASGAFNASRQTGSLLGVAVCGSILNSATHFIVGMHIAFIIAMALFMLGGAVTYIYVGKSN